MPELPKTCTSRCPAPPRASDYADAVRAAAIEEIPEGTLLSIQVVFVLESEMANYIIWMLRILGRGISYWAPETRCRCTDFLFQEWPVIGASVVCVVYMCDIPVISPHPTETTQSEPEIVNALRAKFQDADTLITGTGSTAAGAVDGRTEMAQ